jgi:hypothetical protein
MLCHEWVFPTRIRYVLCIGLVRSSIQILYTTDYGIYKWIYSRKYFEQIAEELTIRLLENNYENISISKFSEVKDNILAGKKVKLDCNKCENRFRCLTESMEKRIVG